MVSRKGDISINTIIYIAIAVFVLIIIIGFATGTFQDLIGSIWKPSEVSNAQEECKRLCANAEYDIDSKGIGSWAQTDYCTKKYPLDIDEKPETPPIMTNCWISPISKVCTIAKTTVDGKTYKCSTDKTINSKMVLDAKTSKCLVCE